MGSVRQRWRDELLDEVRATRAELANLIEGNREFTAEAILELRQNRRITEETLAEVRVSREEFREEMRAQRQALFAVLDRLPPPPGEATA
jgi:plasmid maintenance system antidote protein VapI